MSTMTDKEISKLTGRQKASIFIICLGPERAADVMKHLKDEEVEALTFEIARSESINSKQKVPILKEFHELIKAQDFIISGGIDYAREVLERSIGSQRAMEMVNRLTSSLQVRPFDFIRRTDPQHLVNFVQAEHPQTIALVLSYLEPKKASDVLAQLPVEVQAGVAQRIAKMDRTTPEVLREIERVLERKLSSLASEDFSSAGGIDTTVEILNLADRATEKTIIETLEEEDPELAEEIKKRMFVFEDIVLLDDKSIQKVLREIDQTDLSKALKVVDDEVKDKIFRNMSRRAAQMLNEDMEFMGPIRLHDVEESQQKIVAVIRKLEEDGDVIISRNNEDEMVV